MNRQSLAQRAAQDAARESPLVSSRGATYRDTTESKSDYCSSAFDFEDPTFDSCETRPLLEMDCERLIAQDKYVFYHPVYIGDFIVCCWARSTLLGYASAETCRGVTKNSSGSSAMGDNIYGITMYEAGVIVDPTRDARFRGRTFPWLDSWVHNRFSRTDVHKVIEDIELLVN